MYYEFGSYHHLYVTIEIGIRKISFSCQKKDVYRDDDSGNSVAGHSSGDLFSHPIQTYDADTCASILLEVNGYLNSKRIYPR